MNEDEIKQSSHDPEIKLDMIASLDDNWNNNGAKAFSSSLIMKTRNIISSLNIQPEIFPTACESIQLEYTKPDGSYLEIEISESEYVEIFIINSDGTNHTTNVRSVNTINDVVKKFMSDTMPSMNIIN